MPVNTFTLAADSVAFPTAPTRPTGRSLALPQVTGRDSSGAVYAYRKGAQRRVKHRLAFLYLPSATLTVLLNFNTVTVRGIGDSFTWYDHEGDAHTVYFADTTIAHREVSPGRHQVSIDLVEEVAL
jgi:hypothetical protein